MPSNSGAMGFTDSAVVVLATAAWVLALPGMFTADVVSLGFKFVVNWDEEHLILAGLGFP